MKKIALVLLVFVTSCDENPSYIKGGMAPNINSYDIHYIKDSRTDLCFAERGFGKTYAFTCVPCSDEVENLIKNCNSCVK